MARVRDSAEIKRDEQCAKCGILPGNSECWEKECRKTKDQKQYQAYLTDNYQDPKRLGGKDVRKIGIFILVKSKS